jgi:hypothetical protein
MITRSGLFSFALIHCTIFVSFCDVVISFFFYIFWEKNLLQYKMPRRRLLALKHAKALGGGSLLA